MLVSFGAGRCFAQNYQMTNLTADVDGVAAHQDPNLVNPWGLSRSSGSPWWVSDNATGKATPYDATGTPNALVVTIPAAQQGMTGSPTGTIFNGTPYFEVQPKLPALFLFATEDGTISGWNPGVDRLNAMIKVQTPKAVYKGLTAADIDGKEYLYVTNFHAGRVEVYDGNFQRVHFGREAFRLDCDSDDFFSGRGAWSLFGDDQDSSLFQRLVPFNIQNIGGTLFVTFAEQNAEATRRRTRSRTRPGGRFYF